MLINCIFFVSFCSILLGFCTGFLLYANMAFYISILLLWLLSVEDWRKYNVPLWQLILFFIISMFSIEYYALGFIHLIMLSILLPFLIYSVFYKYLAFADMLLLLICCLLCDELSLPFFILCIGLIGVLFHVYYAKKTTKTLIISDSFAKQQIPFIPVLFISLLINMMATFFELF